MNAALATSIQHSCMCVCTTFNSDTQSLRYKATNCLLVIVVSPPWSSSVGNQRILSCSLFTRKGRRLTPGHTEMKH